WGTNAVNGVINIITKTAEMTQGGAVRVEGGTAGEGRGAVRYGGPIRSTARYRATLRGSDAEQIAALSGPPPSRGWINRGINFRVDWAPTARDKVMFTGDAFVSSVGRNFIVPNLNNPLAPPVDSTDTASGGNVLAKWEHTFSEKSSLEGQVSWEQLRLSDIQ